MVVARPVDFIQRSRRLDETVLDEVVGPGVVANESVGKANRVGVLDAQRRSIIPLCSATGLVVDLTLSITLHRRTNHPNCCTLSKRICPMSTLSRMRIGINATTQLGRSDIAGFTAHALAAEADGFSSYWLAEHPVGGFDALTALAVIGQSVERMELGTAIIPTYPRHPVTLAGQALTTQAAIRGRLSLGIGMSHKVMMSDLGIDDDKPIRHLKEYLAALMPMIETGHVDVQGETIGAKADVIYPVVSPLEVTVAALGPQSLRVAGRYVAGTNLAWVGPKTIREHIVPTISQAAAAADRLAPRIIATLPICVTDDPGAARQVLTANTTMYAQLPSYQAMFEREGISETGELAMVGSEAEVEEQLAELATAGVTDYGASEFGLSADDRARTRALLSRLAASSN
jgi:F420-dependent oxidoreductase-like protein